MPIHDWRRVHAGIFHDFHIEWTTQIKHALNSGILPPDYYALAEQQTDKFEPDVLTLKGSDGPGPKMEPNGAPPGANGGGLKLAPPRARIRAEAEENPFRRKQRKVVVRHVSHDNVVAMIEILSPGNKDSRRAFRMFLGKASYLLDRRIHLLVLDLFPPTPRDPRGLHAAVWKEATGQTFTPPPDKPLTLAAYEAAEALRAYIEPVAVGDELPEMPLFLVPGGHVLVPLEATYRAAFEAVPLRWRRVVAGEG